MFRFLVTTLCLVLPHHVAHANSNGAAACPLGAAAPNGFHIRNGDETTGSLADGGIDVTVGTDSSPASDDMSFPIDTEVTITISSATPFRGFLIRLGPADASLATAENSFVTTVDYPEGSTGIDVAQACTPFFVGGVTHTDASEKTEVNAYMELTQPVDDMVLDISVVVTNGAESEFYYSGFTGLSFTAADDVPAPTAPEPTEPAPTAPEPSPTAPEPAPTAPEPVPAPAPAEPAPGPTYGSSPTDGGESDQADVGAPTDPPSTSGAAAAAVKMSAVLLLGVAAILLG